MIWERPFVEKEAVLDVYDMTGRAGESAFKRLRAAGAISGGLHIRPRRRGHLAGTVIALCSLNRDAAIAYRKGRTDDARRIASWAAHVEASRAARQFVAMASTEPVDDVFEASLSGLVERVSEIDRAPLDALGARIEALREKKLRSTLERSGIFFVAGLVSQVRDDVAEITSTEGAVYALPRRDLAELRLDMLWMPVFVRRVELGPGRFYTFVEHGCESGRVAGASKERPFGDLLPALPDDLDDRVAGLLQGVEPLALTGPVLPRAA